jgi:hypothetical protein
MGSKITQFFFVMFFIWIVGLSFGKYSGGTGEPNDPYLIATPNDLNSIGLDANDWGKHFLMTADINMAGYTYSTALIAPDTSGSGGFDGAAFTGIFDGNDHTVFSLVINGYDYLGLFGQLGQDANIINLRIEDVNITGHYFLGGLCGSNLGGTVNNCYTIGLLTGSREIGGLCGWNEGDISNCYTTGAVIGNQDFTGGLCGYNNLGSISDSNSGCEINGSNATGGLCGWNEQGSITNCCFTGVVTAIGKWTGGLCGISNGNVSNCCVSGTVTGEVYSTGGLIGWNEGDISNCYATEAVTGDYETGGLVGKNNEGTISNCYATGAVTGSDDFTGGLCGDNSIGTISDSYATGTVTGSGDFTGGLCGRNDRGIIDNCYAEGFVDGGRFVGGLCGDSKGNVNNCYATGGVSGLDWVGALIGTGGGFTKCFWDSDINPDANGLGMGSDPNVIGLPTSEMQRRSTFADAGWDMVNIWDIGENQTYPFLRTHLPSDINKDDETNFYDLAILVEHWLEEM